MAIDSIYDAVWFEAQPFGLPFAPVADIEQEYCIALQLAECELTEVLCYCPDLYPVALQIKIALILQQMAPDGTGELDAGANIDNEYVGYVQTDKVFDTTRTYKHFKRHEQLTGSSPASLLSKLIAKCKRPVLGVAITVASRAKTVCAPCGAIDFSRIGGDKADWPYP